MTGAKIDLEEIASTTGLEEPDVARVVVQLISDGWLFSSHVDGDVYAVAHRDAADHEYQSTL